MKRDIKNMWKMKSGEEIEISKMEDTHLINAIKMLRRKAKYGAEVVVSFGYENDNDFMTGDVYIIYGREYLNRIKEYKWLKDEAKKRKREKELANN